MVLSVLLAVPVALPAWEWGQGLAAWMLVVAGCQREDRPAPTPE